MFANAPAGAQEPLDMLVVSRWVTLLLYSVTVVLGIGGNSVVIYSARNIKTKVTNVFLVNLAVADLIFCFTRILSLVHRLRFNDWPFGSFLCKFNGFFKYINMFCSVFLLAVISLDRALCVCRPIFTKTRRTFFVARVVAVCVWTLVIVLSVPFFMYRDIYTDEYNKTKCNIDKGQEKDVRIYLYVLRFVCGFLLPFWVILVCSVVAGLGIKRTNLSRKKGSS
ncbi:C3a anaphylatoxin chemotactic receptor-like [Eucyclogobius newberryi]|uniref:C3a anaphylatoxin chemotactic receptor-like n=1 Tax=Eucyclogobius newberryi TaxID=166745 RepID=UPI003B5C287A